MALGLLRAILEGAESTVPEVGGEQGGKKQRAQQKEEPSDR